MKYVCAPLFMRKNELQVGVFTLAELPLRCDLEQKDSTPERRTGISVSMQRRLQYEFGILLEKHFSKPK